MKGKKHVSPRKQMAMKPSGLANSQGSGKMDGAGAPAPDKEVTKHYSLSKKCCKD